MKSVFIFENQKNYLKVFEIQTDRIIAQNLRLKVP